MTDTEQKALALVNEVGDPQGFAPYTGLPKNDVTKALCRAIEQHEAFRQEVSDAVEQADLLDIYGKAGAYLILQRFIIPKPKPDQLVEAFDAVWPGIDRTMVKAIRAALEARGLEIREKNDD